MVCAFCCCCSCVCVRARVWGLPPPSPRAPSASVLLRFCWPSSSCELRFFPLSNTASATLRPGVRPARIVKPVDKDVLSALVGHQPSAPDGVQACLLPLLPVVCSLSQCFLEYAVPLFVPGPFSFVTPASSDQGLRRFSKGSSPSDFKVSGTYPRLSFCLSSSQRMY